MESREATPYVLALVGAGGGRLGSRGKLHIIFYFASRHSPVIEKLVRFEPRCSGPYSEGLERSCEDLVVLGAVTEGPGGMELPARGGITGGTDAEAVEMLEGYKEFFNGMTDAELLAYAHLTAPEAFGDAEAHRPPVGDVDQLIMQVIRRGIISSERGAELLGVTHDVVLDRMKGMGIRILR
ncbi:MAG: hypothetical protein MPI95_00150 [Nitrosopumilus sp.]|nr:hypothetical protein [Nitrosopumilus sp.]MDA7957491.1 hypothetical protein [Nitrosopumilus sp.]